MGLCDGMWLVVLFGNAACIVGSALLWYATKSYYGSFDDTLDLTIFFSFTYMVFYLST